VIDSVALDVIFSRLNLRVDSISTGTMPDVDVTSRSTEGRVVLVVRRTGTEAGGAGTVAVLHGTAFSAIPDSTPLSFSTVSVWAQEDVLVENDDGSLVVDACGPRFLIRIGSQAGVRIVSPTPVRDHVAIAIALAAPDKIAIDVVDVLGGTVLHTQSRELPSGMTNIDIQLPETIASGTYILRVSTRMSGSTSTTFPVIR